MRGSMSRRNGNNGTSRAVYDLGRVTVRDRVPEHPWFTGGILQAPQGSMINPCAEVRLPPAADRELPIILRRHTSLRDTVALRARTEDSPGVVDTPLPERFTVLFPGHHQVTVNMDLANSDPVAEGQVRDQLLAQVERALADNLPVLTGMDFSGIESRAVEHALNADRIANETGEEPEGLTRQTMLDAMAELGEAAQTAGRSLADQAREFASGGVVTGRTASGRRPVGVRRPLTPEIHIHVTLADGAIPPDMAQNIAWQIATQIESSVRAEVARITAEEVGHRTDEKHRPVHPGKRRVELDEPET